MKRRIFLMSGAAAAAATYVPKNRYKAVVIGDTGHGNYGHGWEMSWAQIPAVTVAAVADPDPEGGVKAQARCRAAKLYRDYREMIVREKPDIVTICPRWCDKRIEMVKAATDAGAHLLIEKPLAASVAEARQVLALIEKKRVKAAVGHTARAMSVTSAVRRMLEAGEFGSLMELRGRGKEDRRAGGEDMIVLGTHVFDLMRYYAGNPKWVFAHVTEQGRELSRSMMRPASEPVGQVGGTGIAAMFLFENGVHGYFSSKASDVTTGRRFGLTIAGSKGWTYVPLNNVPSLPPFVLRSPAWVPEKNEPWERVPYAPGTEPPDREATNHLTAIDLIEAIEKDREPLCSARDGLWTLEMVEAVYRSQWEGKRIEFPLA